MKHFDRTAMTKVPILPKSKMPSSLLLTDRFQQVTNGTPGARQNARCNIACEASTSQQAFLALKPCRCDTPPFLVSVFPGVGEVPAGPRPPPPETDWNTAGAPCVSENYVSDSVVAFKEGHL